MIVISDTTPLNYLVLIEQAEVLRQLYGRVMIPPAVLDERQRDRTPPAVRDWIANRPAWLEVHSVSVPPEAALAALDAGEREAIAFAQRLGADLLLMDDRDGRREALRRHLRITGTLGVLNEAAERGFIDFATTIERLQQTSFRASPELLHSLLDRFK
jgi:predicted nucleic acid-binding protein